jgi:hypothetical protein
MKTLEEIMELADNYANVSVGENEFPVTCEGMADIARAALEQAIRELYERVNP